MSNGKSAWRKEFPARAVDALLPNPAKHAKGLSLKALHRNALFMDLKAHAPSVARNRLLLFAVEKVTGQGARKGLVSRRICEYSDQWRKPTFITLHLRRD